MNFHTNITINSARKFAIALVLFELFLVAVYWTDAFVSGNIPIVHRMFDLDGERNLPTYFSAAQMFLVGVIFMYLAYPSSRPRPTSPHFLGVLGAAFIFLCFDEALAIHERIGGLLLDYAWLPRFKGDHGLWVVPYVAIGLIFLVATYRQTRTMWRNKRRETTIMALGFGVFLLGCVVVEVIGFQYFRADDVPLYLYKFEVAVEEYLEMIGITVVLYGAMLLGLVRHE